MIAVNTNLAAVAGAASAMFLWYYLFGKPDITMACNGMLAGLVAITAPCAFVSPNSAVIIGILAGVLVGLGVLFNERVLKVDDPCGAISVHGYCGWLGAVCVGIFADGTYGAGWNGVGATTYLGKAGQGVTGLLYGDYSQFLTQLGGATLCAVYAFGARIWSSRWSTPCARCASPRKSSWRVSMYRSSVCQPILRMKSSMPSPPLLEINRREYE